MKTRIHAVAAAMLAAAAVSACTHVVSRDVNDQGVAGTVVFPDPGRDLVLKDGTYPNIENLRSVGSGVNKDQLYSLLGRPHFREGLYGVREWDYLFHFRTSSGVRTCQYKIIFDKHALGQSFHWKPADCANVLERPTEPKPLPVASRPFVLEGDGLFAFGKSGLDDLSAAGRDKLRDLASQLKSANVRSVEVLAYTDLIGSASSNLALSQARAETVRSYLVENGVPEGGIHAVGMGARNPVKQCDMHMPRPALIDCLAPNRRVEVRATAEHP